MSEAYLTNWLSSQPCDDRNHFHEIALHEARIASAVRVPTAPAQGPSLVERVRAALAGTSAVDHCDCAATA
ncbi:MAG TPA: hypothetical protein VJ850_04925 [Candidatus Limnocylindrales bacterium]|nr:hypothetical protein [Candidatus Limnocylindrales bacterium]